VILLIGVDDGPLLGVTKLDRLIDTVLIHDAAIDHEDAPIWRPRILQRALAGDWSGPHIVDPAGARDTLIEHHRFGVRFERP